MSAQLRPTVDTDLVVPMTAVVLSRHSDLFLLHSGGEIKGKRQASGDDLTTRTASNQLPYTQSPSSWDENPCNPNPNPGKSKRGSLICNFCIFNS